MKRTESLKICLEKLSEKPYASILCYPTPSKKELRNRLKQLQRLGIDALEFSGAKQAFNVAVIGKGCVGVVTIAYRNKEKLAVKIRRLDADRSRMQGEAELMKMANSVGVGPKLLGTSKDFLLMQFIDGQLLPEWLGRKTSKARIRKVLGKVLEQCWTLDMAGLDHGELSHAPKHLIVDKKDEVFIVDFEAASVNRKTSNVTSICQYLFISGLAKQVAAKLGRKKKKVLVGVLRQYKHTKNRENFEKVLEACGVHAM
jgi:putative serine/threonine protein kinase